MNRTITAAVAALLVAGGLSSCAAAKTDQASAAPAPSAAEDVTDKVAAAFAPERARIAAMDGLQTAIQSYSDALLSGNLAGAMGYLHADCQNDADRGALALAAGEATSMAKGATMTVDSIRMDGDRGRVGDWHLSAGAPDALRRALKASAAEQAASMPWRLVDGEWYFRSTSCTGG